MVLQQQKALEEIAVNFLQRSQGDWNSQRRYYTLNQDIPPQELVSKIKVNFLPAGSPQLKKLALMHGLSEELKGGSQVFWQSNKAAEVDRAISKGSTVLGVLGNILFRDRGFSTPKPVFAYYSCNDEATLSLKTEYDGSVFEEEFKLIGDLYRTRQTIISRENEKLMIGQYLETRIS
jgi:hypothetical protein